MTWTYSDDYYKRYTRDTWNESAPVYAQLRRNLDKFNDALLSLASPQQDERVLDIACGDGEPALTLARRVGPQGKVLGIDLAERMVEAARSHAKAAELENVSFEVMDAEQLSLPESTFDLVTCRFGLQIVTDPDLALEEMQRVLKPGGRVALAVWGLAERCPAIDVIIGPMLEHAEPDETGYLPTPFEMGGEGELAGMLRNIGFHRVEEKRVMQEADYPDAEAFFEATLKGTPIGHSLLEEEPKVQEEVLAKTRENLKRYTRPDGSIRLPAEGVVVSGTK